jgi:RimJ/RimL family protein N-acetyltransferase
MLARDARFREGLRLFQRGDYFTCHEAWEELWRAAPPPRRLFLQSLIHLAVSLHHRGRGNAAGAERQWRKGLKKLAGYLPVFEGIDTGALYRSCAAGGPAVLALATIRLRLLRPSDEDAVYRLLSDLNVIRWMKFPCFSRADAHTYVTQLQPVVIRIGRYAIDRVICAGSAGEALGLCGLVVDRERDEAEAWYLLDPAQWGQGYAVEALRHLLAEGFDNCGLHRVWACCVPENRRSVRVLEKAGLRFEGHHRGNLKIHGEWHDALTYAMLAGEWRPVTPESAE